MDADELYALAPEDFTAARDAAAAKAKAERDSASAKALTALRRPSVAAWLVNRLAARQTELLDQLIVLGPALAEAQSAGRGEELRSLGRQRRELVKSVTDAAIVDAGRSVSSGVRGEVAGTFEAALADPASAQAVRSARLVRALSYAGFGGVDLSGAVAPSGKLADVAADPPAAATARPSRAERDAARKAERRAAERAAHDAAGRLDDAVRTAELAECRRSAAAEDLDSAEREAVRARADLTAAQRERDTATAGRDRAQSEAGAAREAVRTAQESADATRRVLDRLRRN